MEEGRTIMMLKQGGPSDGDGSEERGMGRSTVEEEDRSADVPAAKKGRLRYADRSPPDDSRTAELPDLRALPPLVSENGEEEEEGEEDEARQDGAPHRSLFGGASFCIPPSCVRVGFITHSHTCMTRPRSSSGHGQGVRTRHR